MPKVGSVNSNCLMPGCFGGAVSSWLAVPLVWRLHSKCSGLLLGNAFSCVHIFQIFFLLICSSVGTQLTNFPVENLLRCGSLWAIWKIRTEHLLKCWRLQPRRGKLFSAIFNFLNWRQRVNPAAQWSWSDLSNLNSLTFLHNYSYKMLLNAENMLGFYFFYKG